MPAGARLTHTAKWHVTLVFLGSAPVPAVSAILDGVSPVPPFTLQLSGLFGHFRNIACAGLSGDLAALSELRERIHGALTAGGFPSDDRPYQPHLTVSYRPDRSVREALSGYSGAEWAVTEFALADSRDGEYVTIRTWPLSETAK